MSKLDFNGYYRDTEMSYEVYKWIKDLEEKNKELIDLVKEAEIEMDSWRNLTEIDADSIFKWKEQKNKIFKKMGKL